MSKPNDAMSTDDVPELTHEQRAAALSLAERTVEYGARHDEAFSVTDPISRLFPDGERATFVSVYVEDQLNGCVGCLRASRPLPDDIVHNAYNAAFDDHRFPEIEPAYLPAVRVRISVLDPLEPIPADDESDIWEHVEPGRHGLLLSSEDHRGTFLPSVWEKCPAPDAFLAHLKEKAGLEPDEWPERLRVYRYTTDVFDRETLRANGRDAP